MLQTNKPFQCLQRGCGQDDTMIPSRSAGDDCSNCHVMISVQMCMIHPFISVFTARRYV